MSIESIIKEIETDITDVIGTQFSYSNTASVPNANDAALSYERGKQKSGKILETCVLYVDIRNSVELNETHRSITMGKIYTAFIKAVIKAGREHGGHTRNIIGDRVMIVFPAAKCFENAVKCAVTINYIVTQILNPKFTTVDFKCGIGIDFGELKIIKVGIQRNGTEGPENKGLVWAGNPANIASRLTDMGAKTIKETYYIVTRNPVNPRAIPDHPFNIFNRLIPLAHLGAGTPSGYDPNAPLYLSSVETVEMTETEFAKSFYSHGNLPGYSTYGGKMITFERKERTINYPAILITDRVFKGFRKEVPATGYAQSKYWLEQKHSIRNVDGKIYGSNVRWDLNP